MARIKEVNVVFFVEGLEQKKEFVVLTMRRIVEDFEKDDDEFSLFDIQKIMSKAQETGLQLQMQMNPLLKFVFDMDVVRIPLKITEYEKLGKPTVGDKISVFLKTS